MIQDLGIPGWPLLPGYARWQRAPLWAFAWCLCLIYSGVHRQPGWPDRRGPVSHTGLPPCDEEPEPSFLAAGAGPQTLHSDWESKESKIKKLRQKNPMKDNAAAFLMYECRKFVICQTMFIPEGLPGALPGEYRLGLVVPIRSFAAVEPAEVAQYPLHDHLTLFHGHGGKKDDILADAVTGVHIAAAQGVTDGMVQMLHGLVEDRCPGGMSVQVTDGEQTQIDGIPGTP